MTKLPKRLEEMIEEKAEEYKQRDFNANPNGYTVAPYVNSETTAEAYSQGATDIALAVLSEAAKLVEALEDALGTLAEEAPAVTMVSAEKTLSDWKKFLGEK